MDVELLKLERFPGWDYSGGRELQSNIGIQQDVNPIHHAWIFEFSKDPLLILEYHHISQGLVFYFRVYLL